MSNEKESARGIGRKLAATLSADVQGFSRLMGEDEEVTLRTLTASCQVTDALIQQHRGRVVGSAGDTLETWGQRLPDKDPAVLERHLAALRKAGLK